MRSKFFLLFSILVLLSQLGWARVGGGQGYSRGSSSGGSSRSGSYSSSSSGTYSSTGSGSYSSSGSSSSNYNDYGNSGGDLDLVGFGISFVGMLIALFIFRMVAIPVLESAVVVVERWERGQSRKRAPPSHYQVAEPSPLNWSLLDPNFSRPVFLDFFVKLFGELVRAQAGNVEKIAAYVEPSVMASLKSQAQLHGGFQVEKVIIGAVHFTDIRAEGPWVRMSLEVESNHTESSPEGENSFYCVDALELKRKGDVLSRTPERVQSLGCPNCGNPSEIPLDGVCPYCEQTVKNAAAGQFDWVVSKVTPRKKKPVAPQVGSSGGGIEEGTRDVSHIHPRLAVKKEAFLARHPDFQWEEFEARARHIFLTLQQAWSELEWQKARPYETDNLFNQHLYWMQAYRQQGLRNRLEQVKINRVVVCDIDSDAYYDSIILRIFASMIDVTEESESGRLHSGDPDKPHVFSEYWTFIRRIGRSGSYNPTDCPSCGAPLELNQAGSCEHCQAHITCGEFDWVLSQIEQDESFRLKT